MIETTEPKTKSTSILELNLGIDFGTSFTKVCFRNAGTEQSEIVSFGRSAEDALVPSIVSINSNGVLNLYGEHNETDCVDYRYLKMYLAGFPTVGGKRCQGVNLNDDAVIRALCSWFLAKIIVKAKEWIKINRKDLLLGRGIHWSANVGVPVEHCDSNRIKSFEEVFCVGWHWAESGMLPSDLQMLMKRYEDDICTISNEKIDCHAIPELSAAIQSFVISREAQEDVYMYFDIGGGTVDGVSFNFFASDGEKNVNFYAGKVGELGVSAVSNSFGEDADKVKSILTAKSATELQAKLMEFASSCELLDKKRLDLQKIVGYVIAEFRRKDPLKVFGNPAGPIQSKDNRLIVFIGGGGIGSEWYKNAIDCTHREFAHKSIKIPPYELRETPYPTDFKLNGVARKDYHRFAIAYGLSIPYGEGPDTALPSKMDPVEVQKPRNPTVPNYLDSKDTYD
ncbi:MAG: hypothetical protein OXF20_04080 [Gammaproteobacteria bacterium]|nr:hypothetical protein [Gammaproteobacteria bacterium]